MLVELAIGSVSADSVNSVTKIIYPESGRTITVGLKGLLVGDQLIFTGSSNPLRFSAELKPDEGESLCGNFLIQETVVGQSWECREIKFLKGGK